MDKHHFKLLLGLLLVATFVVIVFIPKVTQGPATSIPQAVINAAASPSPIPSQMSTQESPDGKNTLTMKREMNGSSATYSFSTKDGALFSKTVDNTTTLSIPFNTWSTDDKTVFVKEDTGSAVNWYVYPGGTNVTDFFNKKLAENYKITEVTGWAANTLLIVNTDKIGGGQGFSYWFDISSKSFIQLSNRFN